MIPMKTKLHKLASLLLAFALTLCLALPAGAVGGDGVAAASISPDSEGSITVSGAENGVTVYVYKLMDVNVDATAGQPQEPVYSWVEAVAGWVRKNYSNYIGVAQPGTEPADNSVKEAFSTASAEDVAKFYDALAAAIRSGGANGVTLNPANTSGTIATDGSCTIENLAMGNYLVLIEGGMKVYRPSAVNLVPEWKEVDGTSEWVLSNAAVELKFSDLTLTKQVYDGTITTGVTPDWGETAQVAIGDTVTFKLTAPVPNYPENALHDGYEISDNLPAGLTLGNVTVNGVKNETSSTSTPLPGGENDAYVLTKADSTATPGTMATRPTGGQNANVTFNLEFDYDKIKDYDKIEVTYTATVNADIKVIGQDSNTNGNINTAYLDYNNNPYESVAEGGSATWETVEATATVYTYGVKVEKRDEKDQPLSGATFALTTDEEGKQTISFVQTANGTYRKATQAEIDAERSNATTELVVSTTQGDDLGKLTISGLDVGTYYLTETKAPGGYVKLSTPVEIIVSDSKKSVAGGKFEGGANGKTDTTDDNNNTTEVNDGYVSTKITNTKGFTLPTTGGMGTVLFTAGGVLLMGAGLVVLVLFLRRRTSR